MPAWGQTTLERVEVTGSSIKRLETEEPGPVEVYERRDIQRSGATTVNDFLKNISAIDVFDEGDTGASPVSGSSRIMMRGLSARNVLVLLNGRRVPSSPIQDNSGASAAFDINNLPLSMIERIEILKDGGSAIYGADAVVGVVNFITKRTYKGAETWGSYGQSSRNDGKERTGGVLLGFGDYAESGFNVTGTLDLYKRDPVKRTARDITSSSDWRRFADGKGVDGLSAYHPYGNIFDFGTGTWIRGPGKTCPQATVDDLCLYDTNAETSTDAINGTDRISGLLTGRWRVNGGLRAFGELLMSQSKNTFETPPVPIEGELQNGNYLYGRSLQLGSRMSDRTSDLANLVFGLEGQAGKLDWDMAAGHGRTRTVLQDSNFAAADAVSAALLNGSFDPTSTTNPESVMDGIRRSPRREAQATTSYLNGKATGNLMPLADGPLGYAFGGSLNRETLADRPDADQVGGNLVQSPAVSPVDASRQFQAVFGELSLPLAVGFEGQVALRYDRYDRNRSADGRNAQARGRVSPRVAMRYQPAPSVLLRASYAESFLPPTLRQLFGGSDDGGPDTSDDPSVCSAFGSPCPLDYTRVIATSTELRPEVGRTTGVGFVLEPSSAFSIGVDYFMIRKRDEIVPESARSAVANGRTDNSGSTPIIYTNLVNAARSTVSGTDVDLRARLGETPWGVLSLRNTLTYYREFSRQQEEGGPVDEYVGVFGVPRWRNTVGLNLSSGPWSTTANVRMVSHMVDSPEPATNRDPDTRMIESHEELDLQVAFSGVKGLTLAAGVQNALDADVPYSNTATSISYGATGFPPLYSPRGRFFYMSARYAFR